MTNRPPASRSPCQTSMAAAVEFLPATNPHHLHPIDSPVATDTETSVQTKNQQRKAPTLQNLTHNSQPSPLTPTHFPAASQVPKCANQPHQPCISVSLPPPPFHNPSNPHKKADKKAKTTAKPSGWNRSTPKSLRTLLARSPLAQ